jgi:hypothetical protein
VCAGLLVWVALWLWPLRPACLKLVGAGYHENLAIPSNASGWNGLLALAEQVESSARGRLSWHRFGLRLLPGPTELKPATDWSDGLDHFPEATAVVVVSLHGASDERGPYLLRDVPDPLDPGKGQLYLANVIDRLAKLAPRQFVLVVDATQVPADPTLGILHNDFARQFKLTLGPQVEATPNLVVILSSDDDQRSWVSEKWKQTVFAHFLSEALVGWAADGPGGRITAADVFRYTRDCVGQWATTHRGIMQIPVLIPGDGRRARSFELEIAPDSLPARDGDIPAVRSEGSKIDRAKITAGCASEWEDHARLVGRRPLPAATQPRRRSAFHRIDAGCGGTHRGDPDPARRVEEGVRHASVSAPRLGPVLPRNARGARHW